MLYGVQFGVLVLLILLILFERAWFCLNTYWAYI